MIQFTTMGKAAFLALLREEKLTPPADSLFTGDFDEDAWTWAAWWEEHYQKWDSRLVERLWNALDRLYFYEVVEVASLP